LILIREAKPGLRLDPLASGAAAPSSSSAALGGTPNFARAGRIECASPFPTETRLFLTHASDLSPPSFRPAAWFTFRFELRPARALKAESPEDSSLFGWDALMGTFARGTVGQRSPSNAAMPLFSLWIAFPPIVRETARA